MVAPLDDLPLLQDHDGPGVADGGKPVGDDKHRPARREAVHALFNQFFRPGVDGAGGLVQNQHRRVRHGGPGDCQQLPLPLAETAAVVGDPGVVAVGQVADKGVRICQPRRRPDLLIGGVQLAVADVVGDGAGEEVGVLDGTHN